MRSEGINQSWMNIPHPAKIGVLSVVLLAAAYFIYFFNFPNQIPANVINEQAQIHPPPVQIKIDALNINTPIINLGLNADRTLAVPEKGEEIGWYVGSASPGAIGPSVLVGHLDWGFKKGVFWDLNKLNPGDEIQINRQDGSSVVYKVTGKETYSQDQFPTEKVYGKIDHAGLRLITCSGSYNILKGRYSDNLVVYAELVPGFTK